MVIDLTWEQVLLLCSRSTWMQTRVDVRVFREIVTITPPLVVDVTEEDMRFFIEELARPYPELSVIYYDLQMTKTVRLAHAFQVDKLFIYCNTLHAISGPKQILDYMAILKETVGQHNDIVWNYANELTDIYPLLSEGTLINCQRDQLLQTMQSYDGVMMYLKGYTTKSCIYCGLQCRFHRQEDLHHPRSSITRTKCCDAVMHADCAPSIEDKCPMCTCKLRNRVPVHHTHLQEVAKALNRECWPQRNRVRTQFKTQPKQAKRAPVNNDSTDDACSSNHATCNSSTRTRRNSMPETYL